MKNGFFPNLQKFHCKIFFKIIVHFPFQMLNAINKRKQGVTGLIFLIIGATS